MNHRIRPLAFAALALGASSSFELARAQDAAQQLLFPTPKSASPLLRVASGPIVDLDGDGNGDLAGRSFAPGNLGITSAPGLGNGLFGAPHAATAPPTTAQVELLETFDVDGDGLPDFAHDQGAAGVFYLYLANGDGTYGAPTQYAAPSEVHDIDAADLDLDGDVDLVASTSANGSPSFSATIVLLGDGNGGFVAQSSLPSGNQPRGIVARDLDGDGRADLALLVEYLAQARIFLGLGNGNFVPAGAFQVGLTDPDALLGEDLDGDGDHDLVAVGEFKGARVLLGNGRGAFGPPQPLSGGDALRAPARGIDLELDGDVDLLAATSEGCLGVALGAGDGTFAAVLSYSGFYGTVDIATGDVDGDARPDVAVSDWSSNGFALLRNAGGGELIGALPIALAAGSDALDPNLDLRDIDGDGDLDLAAAASHGTSGALVIAHGNGDGSFATATAFQALGDSLAAGGDLDNDGRHDYVVAGQALVQPLLQQPDEGFAAQPIAYAGGDVTLGTAADLDGDTVLDLVMPAISSQWLGILPGVGDGTFGALATYAQGTRPSVAVAADVDNDGDLDVVLGENLGFTGVYVLENPGNGQLTAPVLHALPFVTQVVPLDYDEDGAVDLAVASTRPQLLLGDGAGNFGPAQPLTPDAVNASLAFGDYDGDGELDLAGGTQQALHVWLGTGALQLGPPASFVAGGTPIAGDCDADGRLDLVTPTSSGARWLRNQHQAPLVASVGGLAAAASGNVVLSGPGLEPSTAVLVDGVPVASTWVAPGALELALAAHAPGHFDVQVSGTFGSTVAADALARWPALSAGRASLGAPLALTLENGGPGLCALAVSGALLPAPLVLPGIHHGLELSSPFVLQIASVPPSGVHVASFLIPNDPQLSGVVLHVQAWASQPGQGATPDTSFANAAVVAIP